MATAPVEVRALLIFTVEPVEVRVRFPKELVLLAARVKAPAELKTTPLANDKAEEFASMFKLEEEVTLLFKEIPEFAFSTTAPVAVKLPVKEMLEGAVRVNAPAADIPLVVALNEISLALVKVTPLAIIILSFGEAFSPTLLESPSKVKAPAVVVRLALTSMPFTDSAVKVENVDAP
jgi:hypothetical protein